MPDVASVDGIGDESQEMAVDITGADEVIDGIMDVENDNVSVEEFIEDLPIQDEPEEQYPLNQEALEEEEEDIWKVPSDELFLELDYLMKCLDLQKWIVQYYVRSRKISKPPSCESVLNYPSTTSVTSMTWSV